MQGQLNLKFPDKPQKTPIAAKTPVMIQYQTLKAQHPDCLLFFRLGDFYELFFDDAVTAARELDIVLTKRGKNSTEEIPMCGVPFHAYESYLVRLIQKGYKVAICEQMETPQEAKKRGAKGPLQRDVVRVVTAGTLTEDTMLQARHNNFLVAISPLHKKQEVGFAAIDISTGTFLVERVAVEQISAVLGRYQPAEIIIPDRLLQEPQLFETFSAFKRQLTPLPMARFDVENSHQRLKDAYQVHSLDAFGQFSETQLRAAGVLLDYIHLTQKSALKLLARPQVLKDDCILQIDAATRRSLELHSTGKNQESLCQAIDHTITAGGGRLLALQLAQPLTHVPSIHHRLDAVAFFVQHVDMRRKLREQLRQYPDVERCLSRLSVNRGGPRDLAALRDGLQIAMSLQQLLTLNLPEFLQETVKNIGYFAPFIDKLHRALLSHDLPMHVREGGFIAEGFLPDLDTYRYLQKNSQESLQKLQAEYIGMTGIPSLKIKHNNIIGHYIEVNPTHTSKVPESFIHRQTLASCVRYSTSALIELERKIQAADQQALALEIGAFQNLVEDVLQQAADILTASHAVAQLDVWAGLAELAHRQGYTRPHIEDSQEMMIEGGFHPVVSAKLSENNETFVRNPCQFPQGTIVQLITGPNMAGKSTYLRQNALIVILAQMGSFVPARSARLGIVDRLFSRVGASDDLAAGHSTFMVEMIETATILHQATQRSFVILDEIGRGTATYDGLAIAWAVVEALIQKNQCRTLFATHYHELTNLAKEHPELVCKTMRIQEWEDKLVFLHEVIDGTADKSYGIHVAALAGLPEPVIARAQQLLIALEDKQHDVSQLATLPPPPVLPQAAHPALDFLDALDVDNLSPREALHILYDLKNKV